MIKKLLLTITFVLCATLTSWAGDGYAYFFGGAGTASGDLVTAHVGGGGEKLFGNVGLSGELGFMTYPEAFSEGIGTASLNGSYHFGNSNLKWRPFATAGYTLFFREGSANLWNFGGGVQHWITPRKGIRLEFRDQVWFDYGEAYHYPTFRAAYIAKF